MMKKAITYLLVLALIPALFSCEKEKNPINYPLGPTKPDPNEGSGDIYYKYGLADLAEMSGIKLGAAFTYWEYYWNPQVKDILTREFKATTFGNEMKHDGIVQANGTMKFDTADQMVQWAKAAGCDLFGHVLGWHSQQQTAYLNTLTTNAEIDQAFKTYVYAMVEHFDPYAWDVVNETFNEYGGFRTQADTQEGYVWGAHYTNTKEWVDKAFEYATDAAATYGKTPILYINDYNLETSQAKRQAFCYYAKNNPQVTGVASQMHLDMSIPNLKSKVEASLRDLAATGKMVRISELDLKSTNEITQADMFVYIFQKYLEIVPAAQRGGITFWGINDKDSWLGESTAPLLWKGTDYQKKKGYDELYKFLCEQAGIDPTAK